ncbi:Gfo/Idh/MocA family oxidoreductase [Glaciihabitans sp. UYNi722]|uniref:Gfo/Idh/MocA family protein n=1 Tax=Glaciihabitans sp. UYNi722 TaxID=3156344 RepID=UPI0033908AF6
MNFFPASTATPLRGGLTLRWGVLAPGRIAADFVQTLHQNSDQRMHAVASRSFERAAAFGARFGIERVYDSYEQLVADPDIDIVYVAAPHSEHRALALLAIAAGKHVLVEKPIALTAAEAGEIANAARSAGVFAMEAMWARFLPQTTVIAALIADGILGDVALVAADYGSIFDFDPASRAFDPALGGGALLDLGVYPIWFAHFVLGRPSRVVASGSITSTGVDGQAAILFSTESAEAQLSASMIVSTPVRATVSGSLASLDVDAPFVAPGGFTVYRDGTDDPLRWDDPTSLRWRDGLVWQATAAAQHVADGLTESPLHPLDTSIAVLETIDEARRQLALLG